MAGVRLARSWKLPDPSWAAGPRSCGGLMRRSGPYSRSSRRRTSISRSSPPASPSSCRPLPPARPPPPAPHRPTALPPRGEASVPPVLPRQPPPLSRRQRQWQQEWQLQGMATPKPLGPQAPSRSRAWPPVGAAAAAALAAAAVRTSIGNTHRSWPWQQQRRLRLRWQCCRRRPGAKVRHRRSRGLQLQPARPQQWWRTPRRRRRQRQRQRTAAAAPVSQRSRPGPKRRLHFPVLPLLTRRIRSQAEEEEEELQEEEEEEMQVRTGGMLQTARMVSRSQMLSAVRGTCWHRPSRSGLASMRLWPGPLLDCRRSRAALGTSRPRATRPATPRSSRAGLALHSAAPVLGRSPRVGLTPRTSGQPTQVLSPPLDQRHRRLGSRGESCLGPRQLRRCTGPRRRLQLGPRFHRASSRSGCRSITSPALKRGRTFRTLQKQLLLWVRPRCRRFSKKPPSACLRWTRPARWWRGRGAGRCLWVRRSRRRRTRTCAGSTAAARPR
mmetsp:Transcript_123514/g.395075  ORF Transcript_123514/g.395075 Transcript_123514/m.395075 type:complete len:497 (-) Transcript_123514:962-2452(-)